jgi:hypothetical protein
MSTHKAASKKSVKTAKNAKGVNGYLEFFKYNFKLHNENPENRFKKLSVPIAGKKFGSEWKALTGEQQNKWHQKAVKINSKSTTKKGKRKHPPPLARISNKTAMISANNEESKTSMTTRNSVKSASRINFIL